MVTNNFSKSSLDLNGKISLNMPTALDWGADGRLYVTEVSGDVKVLTVAFGDPNPGDGDSAASFYVTAAETISLVKNIPNHNDDGSVGGSNSREVTGIDVTSQFDENGAPVLIDGKPAVTVYVTSSDSRIGAGGGGGDTGLDTNSGIVTRLTQTETGWNAVDLVRGLARSEENHALNGLEVIQELDESGHLVSERLIVANGGNANTGAPSNNFAGQQETAYSGAILEVDLDQLKTMEIKTDGGRQYIYDVPTLDDPARAGAEDNNDPFGGNDGFNAGKIDPDGPVQIYSAGYRNAYDVEVTEDGRVWTYDNGSNNSWGGRPIGEAGDNGATVDYAQDADYIATNLNNGDGNSSDTINLESGWNPKNYDQFHEITRSDDLAGRILSAGQGGAATYTMTHPDFAEPLTVVYGGHPNPTRASGGEAGLLFTPKSGVEDAFLLVSEEHYGAVIDWFTTVENESGGAGPGELTSRVISVTPGALYYITENGNAYLVSQNPGNPASIQGSSVLGEAGIPSDFDDVVAALNPIEGNYLEGGYTDGSLDTGLGSINGLTEYTSTVFDDGDIRMSGAILASQYGGGDLIVMGRDENGVMQTASGSGATKAADRITLELTGSPLGLTSIGDDLSAWDNQSAFRGSVWASVYSGSGTKVEILQPNNGAVPLAGSDVNDPTDHDLDGVDNIHDPFEYSATNGLELTPDKAIFLDFQPTEAPYPGTLADTGLMGAALDGSTPNQDANPDQGIPGLFDNGGNIIPGANAPIFQIKNVVPGSVVGSGNGVRDAMQVGVNPSDDVQRLVATTQVQNWIPTAGGVEEGQLTGIMFGDGTQANFVRFVFGEVNGAPGFEVGYEIGDSNYQTLAQVALPALAASGTTEVELRLEIDMANDFALHADYRLNGQDEFTALPLGGFTLPEGVLQDVLTGTHIIGDGDTQLSSGAAFGFLAETSEGAPLAPVNFNNLHIHGFGNEITATTAEGVGVAGSGGVDTILYTGTDTQLASLDGSVENFDGSGSAANFHATGNSGANVMIAGSGDNTFTGGGGADSFQGTLEHLDGTEITDFSSDDEIMVQGASFDASDVSYQAGSAIITINGETAITFSGEDFADFDPDTDASVFHFTSTANGTRITTAPALTSVAAISSGGDDINGVTVRGQQINFLSDKTNAEISGWISGVSSKSYDNAVDVEGSVPDALHQSERSALDTGEWGYSIPVENGQYLIDMYFAEIYHGVENASGAGARVFDISVEGALVEDDYDIIGDVGSAATEVIKTYAVTVTDGVLDIGFDASVNQAKISGLAVWKVDGTYVPSEDAAPPEVVSITLDQPLDNDSAILATVVVTDNAGIDVQSISGDELIFTGYTPGDVSLATGSDAITLSGDGKTATIQYRVSPPSDSNAWSSGSFEVGVAAGSYTDTAGLGVAAYETDAFIVTNLDSLVKGALQRAINVGPTSDAIDNSLEGDDKHTYGGAITNDPILGIDLEADNPDYYSPGTKTGSNIDGKAGTTGSNSGNIDLDGSAYHTYRDSSAGAYTATYDVPNGVYVVELHFAELYQSQAGQRQGDYTIQGEVFAEDFDAFTQAGGADRPVVLTKNVIVTDGKIVIGVNADSGEPGFNAIAIYQAVGGEVPDGDPDTLSLEFNDGDTLGALFDGVTDGAKTDTEETGTATIADGNLIIETTDGDAGAGNDANDNYYTNISGGEGFSASLKFGNPFPTLPAQYSQLGMNVSLSQNEYLKVTFGNTGGGLPIEYSYENGGVQTKQTLGLPSGVNFEQIADVVIALDASVADGAATFSGSVTYLDVSGQALGSTALPSLELPDGPLNTAITTEGATFGVGVTQTSVGSGPNFAASYDYLRIEQNDEELPNDPDSEDDVDGDGIANQEDGDIDGDGVSNGDDVFAYDADNGRPLADGDTLRLDFSVDGTPYQNGFTGVMASSNPAFDEEDTGAGVVENGQLRVTTTSGDTGGANTPQNDYHLGIVREGGFVLETVVDNPFITTPGSFSQLGIAASVNSDDFVKLVFGSVGQDIEFSTRDGNVETKLGADFPGGYGFADFAKAKLVMEVVIDGSGNTTANATITLLDSAGEALPDDASVMIDGLDLTGALEHAIIDPAASVGVGVTHTHGTATPFTAAYDYLEVTATEGDDTGIPPVPATQIEEILASANLDLGDTYGQDDVGSALVTVTPGNNNIQQSNYGNDAFKVQNTGDKKIAAVFFDVTTALYGDSVFDPDGKGGDAAFKEWAINSGGNTGAIQPSGYEHYFLPGTDPDPTNPDNNGGFRGALVKFSASDDGGFTSGEVVGFSGDMDPNSIAGFDKGGSAGVDTGSIPGWDVGGVSGAELIGSNVYIKFTDGSTASGQLMSDGSQAGAQVQITEASPGLTAELSVNGVSSGGQGIYGGAVPSVIVSGPAGEWVRVVMTKGHQPVANDQNGIADTVDERLADEDFPANNAAEFQIVDVQLGASGTADVSQEFTYGDFLNGTSDFDGDDTLPLGFVASVIDNPNTTEGVALGPVSQPIYMISNGSPVDTEPFIDDSIDDQSESENDFVAVVEQASDDVEQGFSSASPDLEIGSYVVGLQFTVPDNVNLDSGDTIDSAVINWVSDRTHSANSTLTFSVENSLNGEGFGSVTDRDYLPEDEVWQASGTWQDGENITAGVDLADQINSLVDQEGLEAGDVITIKIEGAGGTRYVEAAGGNRTAPTLSITMADNPSISQSSHVSDYMLGDDAPNQAASAAGEIDAVVTNDEIGLLGVNDAMEAGVL